MRAYTDGACRVSNPGECSAAWAIYTDDGHMGPYASRYLGPELHTNNFAEYCGLIDLLEYAHRNNLKGLSIYCDSQLVVYQVTGVWKVKHTYAKPLHSLATALYVRGEHRLYHMRGHEQADSVVDREGNTLVDRLCNEVLDKELGK